MEFKRARELGSTSTNVIATVPGKIEFKSSNNSLVDPFAMEFSYDQKINTVNFKAELPQNTWFSVGFGPTMFNTDMILMQAFSTVSKSAISDMWSTKESTPAYDKLDNLTNKNITVDSRGMQIFSFSRKLDTGDVSQDFVIPLDRELTMCYAINYKQANFAIH